MSEANKLFESAEDHGKTEPSNEPGQLETALVHGAQGAMMGGLPIAVGALSAVPSAMIESSGQTAPDAFMPNASPEQLQQIKEIAYGNEPSFFQKLLNAYRENRDTTKDLLHQTGEAHPVTSFVSQLGGGALTGGALVKGAQKAGLVAENLKDLSRLQKVWEAAKIGATGGAIAGGLGGEADLTKGELGQLLTDIETGAAIGGVTGGVLEGGIQGAGATIQGIKNILGKTQLGKQAGRAYELGEMGQGISSEANKEKFAKRINKEAQKLSDTLLDVIERNAKKKAEMLEGKAIDMGEFIQTAEDTIENAVDSFKLTPNEADVLKESIRRNLYKKLPDSIQKIVKTTVRQTEEGPVTSATTTYKGKQLKLADLLQQAQGEQYKPQASAMTQAPASASVSELSGSVGEPLGEIAAKDAAQIVRNLQQQAFEQRLASPGKASTMKNIAREGSQLIKQQFPETAPVTEKMATALETMEQLGEPELIRSLDKKQASTNIIDFIKKFGSKAPKDIQQRENVLEMLKKIDPDYAKRFASRAGKTALDQTLVESAEKQGLTLTGQILGGIKGAGLKGINLAGQTKRIASLPVDKAQQISRQLMTSENPTAQKLGNIMNEAFTYAPEKRAATLFAVSQNKAYRDLINGLMPEDQEEKSAEELFGGAK